MEQAVATCAEARKMLVGIGALDLTDLNAAASYADTADSEATSSSGPRSRRRGPGAPKPRSTTLPRRCSCNPARRPACARRPLMGGRAAVDPRLSHARSRRAATDYAHPRGARIGENEVRFNPSDLGSLATLVARLARGRRRPLRPRRGQRVGGRASARCSRSRRTSEDRPASAR